ncbi:hypothetical protein BDW59DRAFT_178200 [Aspergillus cavernicola]|uniref:F-box domain-containing protein n=1 Tax=Aspergillus cavernicola TaxID=176166 RepID=A0ABR4IQP2_9EURO
MAVPSLHPELIAHIISHIEAQSLAPYASINSQWQALVEKHIFFTLNLNTARLADLQRILKVTLPAYSLAERVQVETDEDRHHNNEIFTQIICTLFTILSSCVNKSNIELSIHNASPSDFTEHPKPGLRRLRGMQRPGVDILHWRYMASYLELLKPIEEIPTVRVISGLVVHQGIERNIAPATVSKLISRLPRLSRLTAALSDNERKDKPLRNRLRYEFAISLTQWPASLEHLVLKYTGEAPKDANYPPAKRSKQGADAFIIMVGPELFWPQNDEDIDEPNWPNLTTFHLTYAAATPSGEWLFNRDPRCPQYEVDRNSENLFMEPPMDEAPQDEFPDDYRTALSPLLNQMYMAAAYAARLMPKLQMMDLIGQVQSGLNGLWRHKTLRCEMKHELANIVEDESIVPQMKSHNG